MPFTPPNLEKPPIKTAEKEVFVEGEPIPKDTIEKEEKITAQKTTPEVQKRTNVQPLESFYPPKDEIQIKIEKVLEGNLEEAYAGLTPIQQQAFQVKGEEVAYKVRELLTEVKVRTEEIWKLIVEWLEMLTGVNKYFIEQEAKNKVDQLVELRENT